MRKFQKLFITIAVSLSVTLTACTSFQVQTLESTGTAVPQNMPNPASVYCKENGNTLVIHTTADGSQSGVCVFPEGGTCEEWAYFRGECGPALPVNPTPGKPVESTQVASNGAVGENASGGYMAPETSEPISNWWGLIKSTPSGAQYDDYFERQDLETVINFGIDSMVPELQAQIVALRDSGKIVHLYGTLFSNMPDVNGSLIQVDRIEVGVESAGSYMPPGKTDEIADWQGVIKSTPTGAQYDDYFELWTNGQVIYFGIDAMDLAVKSQIEALRDSGKVVHLYGTLFSNVPDYNGSLIQVDRIEVDG
ncbi:MAG TPA: DUF333 domain-containing protein [Anaerolineaceae bacterium]|nr:DUF333 domain-containing protein [Anaerolineaceae bacterium]